MKIVTVQLTLIGRSETNPGRRFLGFIFTNAWSGINPLCVSSLITGIKIQEH